MRTLIKRVVDLKVGDVVVNLIAPGESKIKSLQYQKNNTDVKITATNGAVIILDQFVEVDVATQ